MRKTFTESVASADRLIESVEDKGLDPNLYLAVVEAELGKGGVVNMNNRIYQVDEFVSENESLSSRVKDGFVEGELGHPMGGPTFDVPVQLVDVEVDVDESMNTATARGSFAILNTQAGRDILTLYKAEMPIGTSSRGTGMVEKHTIDEGSPYYRANTEHHGKEVYEVNGFNLLTYDLVRVPSAGTHFQAATTECQEALARLNESGFFGASSNPMEEDMVEETKVVVEAEEAAVTNEEPVVSEVAETEVAEAVENTDADTNEEVNVEEAADTEPVAAVNTLSEEQQKVLMRLASVIESASADNDKELAEQVKRVADQAEVDRVRLAEAEEVNRNLEARLSALTEEIEAQRHAEEIRKAVEESVDGMNHALEIRVEVEALVNEGRLTSADEISVWAKRLSDLVENAVAKSVETAGSARVVAVDESDDLVQAEEGDAVEAVVAVEESFMSKIEKILANHTDR